MTDVTGRRAGRAAAVAYAAVAVLVAALVRINVTLPGIGHLGSALVAVVFLYAPVVVGTWLAREPDRPLGVREMWAAVWRGDSLDHWGFHAAPVRRGLTIAGVSLAVLVPLFAAGFIGFYAVACGSDLLGHLVPRNLCSYYSGIEAMHRPRIFTFAFAEFCLIQLIVVALPEELFFRGCLLRLLEQRFPPRRRILGGGVGIALVISAAAFALVHLPKDGDPRALATFFPALLFGWMRSATGSILASTITHGGANILVRVLELSLFR